MAKNVIPGEFIGTEEEFVPGNGTYAEKDGVRSSYVGTMKDDNRTLSVDRHNMLSNLKVGTIVIGRVENIVEPIALVNVIPHKESNQRFAQMPDYCVLHASRIKEGFVKNVRDELRIGDIVRAKVVEVRNGELHISTEGAELGVVKAFCSKCRHALSLVGASLVCNNCGAKENRKITNDYRSVSI